MNFCFGSHFRTLPAWYDTDFSSDIYGYGDVHVLYESFNPPGQDEKFFRIHHAFLPDGIFFEHSPLFRSDMHTKASKKDSLLTVCNDQIASGIDFYRLDAIGQTYGKTVDIRRYGKQQGR